MVYYFRVLSDNKKYKDVNNSIIRGKDIYDVMHYIKASSKYNKKVKTLSIGDFYVESFRLSFFEIEKDYFKDILKINIIKVEIDKEKQVVSNED